MMQQQPQPQWTVIHNPALRPERSILVVINDYIIAVGGDDQPNDPRQIRIFEAAENPKLDPNPQLIPFTNDSDQLNIVDFSACAYDKNKIVIFGGRDLQNHNIINNDVFVITLQERDGGRRVFANCKIQTTTANGCRRAGHTAHIFNNTMYVIGGTAGQGDNANRVWELELHPYYRWTDSNVGANNPLHMPSTKPITLVLQLLGWADRHRSVLMDSKIYIHNKHERDALQYVNDQIYMLNLPIQANPVWTRVNAPALNYRVEPLNFDEMKGIDNKLFFFERDPENQLNYMYPRVIHCYNTTNGTWTGRIKLSDRPDLADLDLYPLSLITYKNRLVLWGLNLTIYHLNEVPNLPFEYEPSEEEYRRLITDRQAQNAQLQAQHTNLERDLQARDQRIAQLGAARTQLANQIQGRAGGERLANEVNGLQQRLIENQQRTRNIENGQVQVQLTPDLEEEIRRSERRKNDSERECQRARDAQRALEIANKQLNERLEGSREESKISEGARSNISERIHREKINLSELEERKDQIEDRINQQAILSNRLERERARLESQLIERQNDIGMLKADNTRLKGNYSSISIALILFCLLLLNYLWKS